MISSSSDSEVNSKGEKTFSKVTSKNKQHPDLKKIKHEVESTLSDALENRAQDSDEDSSSRNPASDNLPIAPIKWNDLPLGIQNVLRKKGVNEDSKAISIGEEGEQLFESKHKAVTESEYNPMMGQEVGRINGLVIFNPVGDTGQDFNQTFVNPANWQTLVSTGSINCYYKEATYESEVLQVLGSFNSLKILKHDREVRVVFLGLNNLPKGALSRVYSQLLEIIPKELKLVCSPDFAFRFVN